MWYEFITLYFVFNYMGINDINALNYNKKKDVKWIKKKKKKVLTLIVSNVMAKGG